MVKQSALVTNIYFLFGCATLLIADTLGHATTVVSPGIYANAEAPTSSGQFGQSPSRALGIHAPSEFVALPPGGAVITELSFRPDGTSQVGETGGFTQLTVSLSITSVDPSDISDTFDDNVTGTPVVVYDGPWTGTVINGEPPGPDTRPFDFRFPLQTAYPYDPADGNLLIDWIVETAPGEPAISWDNDTENVLPGQQYLFGLAASQNADITNFSLVTEFTFVPEPTTSALALAALCLAISKRRMAA